MQIVIDREAVIIMYAIALHSIIGGDYEDIKETVTELVDKISYTVLPEGHGRLIDADRLKSMYSINRANFNTVVGIQKWIDDAPTIIEPDTKSEDKNE